MAENVYEGMFILDSNRYSRDSAGVSKQISAMVENHGGEMLVSRLWEERRLAYPIRGQRKGAYWLSYFRLKSDEIPKIERACQLNDNILRALILKVDARIVDALVSHAQSGTSGDGGRTRSEPVAAPVARAVADLEVEIPEGLND